MRHAQSLLIWLAAQAICSAVVVGLVFGAFLLGPLVETKVWPIVKVRAVEDITRDAERVCWTQKLEKVSWAINPRYEWKMVPLLGPEIPVAAYLVDNWGNKLEEQELVPHKVGESWSRRYCFDIAGRVPDKQGIRLVGIGEHRRHRLWASLTFLPTIFVCPEEPRGGCQSKVSF